jgi:hypothetical protein
MVRVKMQRILSAIVGVFVVATVVSASAQQPPGTAAGRRLALRASAAIQATAFTAVNGVLANTMVRLRDARLGRIVGQSLTDEKGACIFKGLDRGNYVVELVSNRQTTLAATPLISVNAGETVAAVVKMPFKPSLLGTLLGQEPSPVAGASAFGSSETAGISELPQTVVQLVPTLVAVGAPVSER